jgi:hypothetical protein
MKYSVFLLSKRKLQDALMDGDEKVLAPSNDGIFVAVIVPVLMISYSDLVTDIHTLRHMHTNKMRCTI